MKTTEEYWTNEYLAYAKEQVAIKKHAEEEAQTTRYKEVTEVTTIEKVREIPSDNENSKEI